MRVICIDGVKIGDIGVNKQGDTRPANSNDLIFEGVVYTVEHDYGDTYSLVELRNPFASYGKRRFAPLSEINEKEFERNYQKELA